MNRRPTPETDKAKCKFTSLLGDDEDAYWVHLTVARKLERERDQYKGLLIRLYNDLFVIHNGVAIADLKKEFREENYN